MRVALFAEGRSDIAVITNILKGWLNIDRSDISYEVPEFHYDETDLSIMKDVQHSNWTIVKKSCIDKSRISKFIDSFDDNRFIVIQIDTMERFLIGYEVINPLKSKKNTYSDELRINVIEKINQWLNNEFIQRIAYAVCIEEMEAWIYTIYSEKNNDTSEMNNPKEKLDSLLNKKLSGKKRNLLKIDDSFKKYTELSYEFRKKKKLLECIKKNSSLKFFCESLDKL